MLSNFLSKTLVFLILAVCHVFSCLPLRWARGIGACLGSVVYACSARSRSMVAEHFPTQFSTANPSMTVHSLLRESGLGMADMLWVWFASPARVMRRVEAENIEVIDALLRDKTPFLTVTLHTGCFELVGQWMATRIPCTALYKPPHKAYLKPLLEGKRARHNLALAPANLMGVRRMLKALKRGDTVALLPDQVPSAGDGVWVNWFGKPAYTMTLPAKLARATMALPVFTIALRTKTGWKISFTPKLLPEILANTENTEKSSSQEKVDAAWMNAASEAIIALAPEQYMWAYRRYKTPAGVLKPNTKPLDILS